MLDLRTEIYAARESYSFILSFIHSFIEYAQRATRGYRYTVNT